MAMFTIGYLAGIFAGLIIAHLWRVMSARPKHW